MSSKVQTIFTVDQTQTSIQSPVRDVDRFELAIECVRDVSELNLPKLSPAALTVLKFVRIAKTFRDSKTIKLDGAARAACLAISQVYFDFMDHANRQQGAGFPWPPTHQIEAWESMVAALNAIADIASKFVRLWKQGLTQLEVRSLANHIIQLQNEVEMALKAFEVADHNTMWDTLEQLIELGQSDGLQEDIQAEPHKPNAAYDASVSGSYQGVQSLYQKPFAQLDSSLRPAGGMFNDTVIENMKRVKFGRNGFVDEVGQGWKGADLPSPPSWRRPEQHPVGQGTPVGAASMFIGGRIGNMEDVAVYHEDIHERRWI